MQQELFTSETRPQSVRQLYKESGKEQTLLPLSALATPSRSVSVSFNGDLQLGPSSDDMLDGTQDSDELALQCSDSDFGNANRKLRTRIDAEIEIRLVSCINNVGIWALNVYKDASEVGQKTERTATTAACVWSLRLLCGLSLPALSQLWLSMTLSFRSVVKRVGDHTQHTEMGRGLATNELKSSRVQFS